MGAGRVVSGKKTESKLVVGEVGVKVDRWWTRFSSYGEEVLGEFSRFSWWPGLVRSMEGWGA